MCAPVCAIVINPLRPVRWHYLATSGRRGNSPMRLLLFVETIVTFQIPIASIGGCVSMLGTTRLERNYLGDSGNHTSKTDT